MEAESLNSAVHHDFPKGRVIGTRTVCTFVHTLRMSCQDNQEWTRATYVGSSKMGSAVFVLLAYH